MYHEYFIPTKFHQNPSRSSGEEVENVKVYGRTTTDSALWQKLTWAFGLGKLKTRKCKQGNRHYFESFEYRDAISSNKAIEFWRDCLTIFVIWKKVF